MKKTAYGTPLLLKGAEVKSLKPTLPKDEATIQKLIFDYPECLPISEINESYNPVIPVCEELYIDGVYLDIFMVSPNGELILIETKLWKNPEARREVVAQILEYAQKLSKWSYAELQREVNKQLKTSGNTLYEIAKAKQPDLTLDEPKFADAVSRNLKNGRFLLLIAGDGIREGAAGIAEFLTGAGHLNFTFAMVELALYKSDTDERVIAPRVLAKTVDLTQYKVQIPEGLELKGAEADKSAEADTRGMNARMETRPFYNKFWKEFRGGLAFDDSEQPMPNMTESTNLYVYPSKNSKNKKLWISAFFSKKHNRVGVYVSRYQDDPLSKSMHQTLRAYKEQMAEELGEDVEWSWDDPNYIAGVDKYFDDVHADKNREAIKKFFQEWLNKFVNTFRPRLKDF